MLFRSCSPLENPNDPSDTVGVPAAYMFSAFIMGLGVLSWCLSFVGLLVCKFVSGEHVRTKLFISSVADFPLRLTCIAWMIWIFERASNGVHIQKKR